MKAWRIWFADWGESTIVIAESLGKAKYRLWQQSLSDQGWSFVWCTSKMRAQRAAEYDGMTELEAWRLEKADHSHV